MLELLSKGPQRKSLSLSNCLLPGLPVDESSQSSGISAIQRPSISCSSSIVKFMSILQPDYGRSLLLGYHGDEVPEGRTTHG